MGRGRAKAKQTKVARKLKYSTPPTDLEALKRELSGKSSSKDTDSGRESEYDYDYDYGYEDEYRR